MEYSGSDSAIDDRVETVHFGPPPRSRRDLGSHNGPREGRWSASSTCGSAVDDRCPTVWQLGKDRSANGGTGNLDSGLLRKLAKATLEARKATEPEVKHARDSIADSNENQSSRLGTSKATESRGFYVPQLKSTLDIKKVDEREDHKPPKLAHARPRAKSGRDQARPQQFQKQERPKQAPQRQQAKKQPPLQQQSKDRQPKKVESASPQSDPSLETAPSSVTTNRAKSVRSVGKDGREVFMELPDLPQISRPASKYESREGDESSRTKAAKLAAKLLMSGALPVHSPKYEQEATRNVRLKEASRASVSMRSSKAFFVKDFSAAIERINKNSEIERSHDYTPVSGHESAARSARGFTPLRFSDYVPQSVHGYTPPRSATPEHPFWDSPQVKSKQPSLAASRNSMRSYRLASASVAGASNVPPTIYAGKGWVTPHPLSQAPSYLASPPQSRIELPDNGSWSAREMTHAEYEAIQQGQGQIRGRSDSDTIAPSRVKSVASNVTQGEPRRAGVISSNYRRASAESHDSHHHFANRQYMPPSYRANTLGEAWLRTREEDEMREFGMAQQSRVEGSYRGASERPTYSVQGEQDAQAYESFLQALIVDVDAARGVPEAGVYEAFVEPMLYSSIRRETIRGGTCLLRLHSGHSRQLLGSR